MKIQSIFEVLKREEAMYPEARQLFEYNRGRAAAKMGMYIAEQVPYEKDVKLSWPEGKPLLSWSAYIGPPEVDYYRCEFVLLTKRDWQSLKEAVLQLVSEAAIGSATITQATAEILRAVDFYAASQV